MLSRIKAAIRDRVIEYIEEHESGEDVQPAYVVRDCVQQFRPIELWLPYSDLATRLQQDRPEHYRLVSASELMSWLTAAGVPREERQQDGFTVAGVSRTRMTDALIAEGATK